MGRVKGKRNWERINAIADAYRRTGGVRFVAAEFGITTSAVSRALKLAGAAPGRPDGAKLDRLPEWPDMLKRCYELKSVPKVAQEFGVSQDALYWALKQNNVRLKPYKNPEALFWSRIEKRSTADCWLWRGSLHKTGYGSVQFRLSEDHDWRVWFAHRLAWVLTHGEITDASREVAHLCGIRNCCNPHHLKLVSIQENREHISVHRQIGRGPQAVAQLR